MAVGATAQDILSQFLTEAVLLCMAGGIIGILLGVGIDLCDRPGDRRQSRVAAGRRGQQQTARYQKGAER